MSGPSLVLGRRNPQKSVTLNPSFPSKRIPVHAFPDTDDDIPPSIYRQPERGSIPGILRNRQEAKGVAPIDTSMKRPRHVGPDASPTPSVSFDDLHFIANQNKIKRGPDAVEAAAAAQQQQQSTPDAAGFQMYPDDYSDGYASDSSSPSGSDYSSDDSDRSGSMSPPGMPDVEPIPGVFDHGYRNPRKRPREPYSKEPRMSTTSAFKSAASFAKASKSGLSAQQQMEKLQKERMMQRAKLLSKFERMNQLRTRKIDFRPDMSLEQLQSIDESESYSKRSEMTVKILRRLLVFSCWCVENIAPRIPMIKADLEGWSESIYLSLDTYDEFLYEINDEYFSGMRMNPVLGLVLALSTNAMMYSMTKKLMNNPAFGSMMNELGKATSSTATPMPPNVGPIPKAAEFKTAAAAAKQAQPQPQAQPAPARTFYPPANPFASLLSGLFGGGRSTATRGQPEEDFDMGLDSAMHTGQAGEPDLNKLFSGLSGMLSRAGAVPSERQAPETEISEAGAAEDLRDAPIELSHPPLETVRVPHASEAPPPLPLPVLLRDREQKQQPPPHWHETQQRTETIPSDIPQGAIMIEIMRKQQDRDQKMRPGAKLEEIKEGDEEEPIEPEPTDGKGDTREVTLPPPRKRARTTASTIPGKVVSLDNLR
jgi:hypothetical protein